MRSSRRTAGLALQLVVPWSCEALTHFDPLRRRHSPARRPAREPRVSRELALARVWASRLRQGSSQAEIARDAGVSPARVSAVLRLLDLEPALLRRAEAAPRAFDVRELLALARRPLAEQARALAERTAPIERGP